MYNKITKWILRNERRVSSFFLLAGFVIDSLTLKRVDSLFENLWTIGLLLGASISIILTHTLKKNKGDEKNPHRVHFWLVNALQFFFGGLLSVFLVFYFRSGDLFVSWPFLLVLVIACLANEVLKKHYVRLIFQISLFFLILFCFTIFIVPVFTHKIGTAMFLLSGALSLVIIFVFIYVISKYSREDFIRSRKILTFSILGIFLGINLLYFSNLIPPIPLSLKDSGVFYNIEKNSNGAYVGEYQELGWQSYFVMYDNFYINPDTSIYAYSAVFAPTSLNTTIVHNWQYYEEISKKWVDYDKVELPVVGGRDGGFRTYSNKTDLMPGKWRVSVENILGQLIGRIRFNLIYTDASINLENKILE